VVNEEFKVIQQLLKEFVKEYSARSGSHPEENYHTELLDDPAYKAASVYVPDDIKKNIDKWAKDMGMSTEKKKNKR